MFSRKGATKHCCYGTCNSDSRYDYRPHMKGVKWYPFPKPKRQLQKCARWVNLCRREGFTIESVTKDTYICSKHFPGGSFIEDPFPATANEDEKLKKKVKRKPQERYPEKPEAEEKALKMSLKKKKLETFSTDEHVVAKILLELNAGDTSIFEVHNTNSESLSEAEEKIH